MVAEWVSRACRLAALHPGTHRVVVVGAGHSPPNFTPNRSPAWPQVIPNGLVRGLASKALVVEELDEEKDVGEEYVGDPMMQEGDGGGGAMIKLNLAQASDEPQTLVRMSDVAVSHPVTCLRSW